MKKILPIILIFALLLSGCAPSPATHHFFAMDTVMTLQLYGSEADALACEELVKELEEKLSVTRAESEISALNATGTATLSADTAAVLEAGLRVHKETGGAFALSIYPAVRLWGFTEEQKQVPADAELEKVRPLVKDSAIRLEGKEITLAPGMALDVGGIAKGYTADRLALLLKERQVEHYFLSLGGNVQVGGGKPDGSPWRVGIADPQGGDPVGVVELTDGAVVTSGGYQRNFIQDGVTYHHILDPRTLKPAQSGLVSVSVVGQSGTLADGYSTALFIMGEQKALEFCADKDIECILITEDGRVVVSEGLKGNFTLANDRYIYEE